MIFVSSVSAAECQALHALTRHATGRVAGTRSLQESIISGASLIQGSLLAKLERHPAQINSSPPQQAKRRAGRTLCLTASFIAELLAGELPFTRQLCHTLC